MPIPTVSPGLLASTYTRTELNASSEVTLAPAPIASSYPGNPGVWGVAGDAWQFSGDKGTVSNQTGADDVLYTILPIQQTAAGPVTFRVKAEAEAIAQGADFSIELTLTDEGGLAGGVILADETLAMPAGTWPETQLSVTATAVPLSDPAAALAPQSQADASSTLAVGPWYLDYALTNDNGSTTPGGSEAEITLAAADAYAIEVQIALPQNVGATGIILGMGGASGAEAQFAKVSAGGAVTYVGSNAAGVAANVNSGTLTLTLSAAPTDTSAAMPVANTATAVAAYYVYAYVFARYGTGALTAWDAEIFSATAKGAATAGFGEWHSAPVDLYLELNAPITVPGYGPERILFFYEDFANVDQLDSVSHSEAMLSSFGLMVIAEPGQWAGREDEVAQALIAKGVALYGYAWTGQNLDPQTVAQIEAIIDRCAEASMAGVFFDAFGYDYAVPRALQNEIVGYAHARGLKVIANAYHAPDALGSAVDPTYNPYGTPPELSGSHGDWYSFESFYSRSDGTYAGVPEGGFAVILAVYQEGVALARALGVKTLGLAYAFGTTPLDDPADEINGYVLAAMLGLDAYTYSSNLSSGYLGWPTTATEALALGTRLLTPIFVANPAAGRYNAITDHGVLWFVATDGPPASRSSGTYATDYRILGFRAGALPPADPSVERLTTFWETSPDLAAWAEIEPGITPGAPGPQRFLRYRMRLRNTG